MSRWCCTSSVASCCFCDRYFMLCIPLMGVYLSALSGLIHQSGRKGHLGKGTLSTEHMLHRRELYSVLTPFGAHTHVAEETVLTLWLQAMTRPFGGAAGTGLPAGGLLDGWLRGWIKGWMDGQTQTLNTSWHWCMYRESLLAVHV